MQLTTLAEAERALRRYWPDDEARRQIRSREYMERFMDFLGNPQNRLRVVHIAGTSGKTSTAYYCAALLRAAGAKVGQTASPFVYELNERVQVGGVPMPEAQFCEELAIFLKLVEASGLALGYHEVIFAFAYWEFARQRVDYAVIETGMGGSFDPTNVVDRQDKLCVITDIGLDHVAKLGGTLPEIATHKAGIIQLHNQVFCHRQNEAVLRVIQERCRQKQADLHILADERISVPTDFLPLFQRRNFSLAYAAIASLGQRDGLRLSSTAIEKAAHTVIPARMETLHIQGKTVIIDGAHNPQKMRVLVASMRERYGDVPIAALAGFIPEHQVVDSLRELSGLAEHIIMTQFGETSLPFPSLSTKEAGVAAKEARVPSFEAQPTVGQAVQTLLKRPEPVLLVTGSLYLAAPAKAELARRAQG